MRPIQRQVEAFAYRAASEQKRWFHVSPHDIPEGTVLTPGAGESSYPEGAGHDRIWVHPNLWWWDKVHDKGWHLYEVQPHGDPVNEGDSGWSTPAATVITRHAAKSTPDGITIGPHIDPDFNMGYAAQAWDGDRLVGYLSWHGKDTVKPGVPPTIGYISVHPDYRHRGIATSMINWVRQHKEPKLDFDDWLSKSGKGLAESMGYVPKNWDPAEADTSDENDDEWLPGGRFDYRKAFRKQALELTDEEAAAFEEYLKSNGGKLKFTLGDPEKVEPIPPEAFEQLFAPMRPSGKWYHVSPHELAPGTDLIAGGPDGKATSQDFYDMGFGDDEGTLADHGAGRNKHIWVTPDLDDAHFWSAALNAPHIYEVDADDEPQPWNGTGTDGWITTKARIRNKVSADPVKEAAAAIRLAQRIAMPAPMPEGVTFHHHTSLDTIPDQTGYDEDNDEYWEYPRFWPPAVEARLNGQYVGHLQWEDFGYPNEPAHGMVSDIHVEEPYRRHGIGTALFDEAKRIEPKVHHSPERTELGKAWVQHEESRHKHAHEGGYDDTAYWATAWDDEDDDDDQDEKPHKKAAAAILLAQEVLAMADTTPWHPLITYKDHHVGNEGWPYIRHYTVVDRNGTTLAKMSTSHDNPAYPESWSRKYPEVMVNHIVVHPDFKGRGIGQALIERVAQDFPDHRINPGSTTSQGNGFTEHLREILPDAKKRLVPRYRPKVMDDATGQPWIDEQENRMRYMPRRRVAMPAPAPEGLHFKHVPSPYHDENDPSYLGRVEAYVGDDPVGHMEWLEKGHPLTTVTRRKPGEVSFIFVHPSYRRHNIATEMFDWTKNNVAPDLHHSQRRTDLGDKWISHEQGRQKAAMAWTDWAPKIRNDYIEQYYPEAVGAACPPGGGCKHDNRLSDANLHGSGYWIDHGDEKPSRLTYYHKRHPRTGEPYIGIGFLTTNKNHRNDGVAEALIRRLAEDHPGMRIHPGGMTTDGRAFHDRMLEKEPEAKDVLKAAAAVLKIAEPLVDAYDPQAVWFDDYVPPEHAKADTEGPWYHITPYLLKPGDRLKPKPGRTNYNYTPDEEFINEQAKGYMSGLPAARANWTWMAKRDDVDYWLHLMGKAIPYGMLQIYEVQPEIEGPWPYNGSGVSGHVSPEATVIREIPHKDGGMGRRTIMWPDDDPVEKAAAVIRDAQTVLAGWHTDPDYFSAVHEMAHVLDAVGGFKASDTLDDVLKPIYTAETGVQMSDEPGAHWIGYRDWLRKNLPGRGWEPRYNKWGIPLGGEDFNPKEAIAAAFVEHELNPEASTAAMRALHQHLVDTSAKAGRPTNLTTFRPRKGDGGALPKAFVDGIQHIFQKYPQSRIVDMVEPKKLTQQGEPAIWTNFGKSKENKPRIQYDERATQDPSLMDDLFVTQRDNREIGPWMWEDDPVEKAAAVIHEAETEEWRTALTNYHIAERFTALNYHGPDFGRQRWRESDHPHQWTLADHLPTDIGVDKDYPPWANIDWDGEQPTGKWYHASPYELEPGERLIPHSERGGFNPRADYYTEGRENRPNYVWLSPTMEMAQHWAKNWGGPHIYEVDPGDRPQRYNMNENTGWVVPHATVKRKVATL